VRQQWRTFVFVTADAKPEKTGQIQKKNH